MQSILKDNLESKRRDDSDDDDGEEEEEQQDAPGVKNPFALVCTFTDFTYVLTARSWQMTTKTKRKSPKKRKNR